MQTGYSYAATTGTGGTDIYPPLSQNSHHTTGWKTERKEALGPSRKEMFLAFWPFGPPSLLSKED